MSGRYTLAIFDFDGTLADSGPWFAGALNETARRFRFREVGEGEHDHLRNLDTIGICRHLGLARWKLPFVARHMRKLAARDIAGIKLFPGIDRALLDLHDAGMRLAIVSSNTEDNVRSVLGADLTKLIEIFACGTSTFGKAARFRKVLKRAGVDAQNAIAIGDEARDLEAAADAGMSSGAVTWGYAAGPFLAGRHPTLMFERVADISGIARIA